MFGLSFTHLILLAVIALVFIGPEQLPEVARTLARLLNEWKRATGEIQTSLTKTIKDDFIQPPPQPAPTPAETLTQVAPPAETEKKS
jgi:Tat protein translocase TatB subunit